MMTDDDDVRDPRHAPSACPTCASELHWDPVESLWFCPNEWQHL